MFNSLMKYIFDHGTQNLMGHNKYKFTDMQMQDPNIQDLDLVENQHCEVNSF